MSRRTHFLPVGGAGAAGGGLGSLSAPTQVWTKRLRTPSAGGKGQLPCKRDLAGSPTCKRAGPGWLANCRTVDLFHDIVGGRMGSQGARGKDGGVNSASDSLRVVVANFLSTKCVPDTAEALWNGDLCCRGSSRSRGAG